MSNASQPATSHPFFRSWETSLDHDMVDMPRALALDLIRLLDVTPWIHEASEDELEANLHYTRWADHKVRMEAIASDIGAHLCEENITPNADKMLRAVVMAYEAAAHLPRHPAVA